MPRMKKLDDDILAFTCSSRWAMPVLVIQCIGAFVLPLHVNVVSSCIAFFVVSCDVFVVSRSSLEVPFVLVNKLGFIKKLFLTSAFER